MELNLPIFSFRSGVITRKLKGQPDLNLYKSGVEVGENFIFHVQGPAEFRPGFSYVKLTRRNQPAWFLPFVFSDNQAYVLEFTDKFLRFHASGGVVTETAKVITGASKALPCQITSAGHGFANGDEVYIDGIVGMDELNGQFYLVTNVALNTFTLTDIDGNGIDSTAFTTYASGGTVARVYEIATPYAYADLPGLQLDGRNDLRYIVHNDYAPRKLTRLGAASWTLTTYTRTDDPYGMGVITGITQANPGAVTTSGAHGFTNGDLVRIEDVTGMTQVNNQVYTITSTGANTFTIGVSTVAFTPYGSGGVCAKKGDYPGAVGIYGGRLFFGGSDNDPDILQGSMSPDSTTGAPRYDIFTVGTDPEDAVTFALSSLSKSADKILFYVGTRSFLAAGTYGGMVKVNGGADGKAIAGNAIECYPIDAIGVEDIVPAAFGADILYVQRGGQVLLSFQYSLMDDAFTSVDETIQNDETLVPVVKQLTYQQGRPNLVWMVLNDGTLRAITYKRSEDASAWGVHKVGGSGEVITLCGQPQANNIDRLWICVKRTINGVVRYQIEASALNDPIPEFEDYFTGDKDTDTQRWLDMMYEAQIRQIHCDCASTLDTTQGVSITPSSLVAVDECTGGTAISEGDSTGDVSLEGTANYQDFIYNSSKMYDGVTNAAYISEVAYTTASDAKTGRDWGAGVTRSITSVKVFGSNNYGFDQAFITSSVTIKLLGSNDNVNWINLGADITFANQADESAGRTLTPTNLTAFRYHSVQMYTTSNYKNIAELQFFDGPRYPSRAYDNDNNTVWSSSQEDAAVSGVAAIGYDFGISETRTIVTVTIDQPIVNEAITSILAQFSADGSSWSTAATITPTTNPGEQSFTFTNTNDERYFRLLANANPISGPWTVNKIQFKEAAATVVTPPVKGNIVIFTATTAIFKSTDVGRYIKIKHLVGGETGVALIQSYISSLKVETLILEDFNPSGTIPVDGWYFTVDEVSGLNHLEGATVSVVADGGVETTKTVVNGAITLDGQASYVIVGFPYLGRLRTMPLEMSFSSGITMGHYKSVNRAKFYFRNTIGASFGYNPYDLKTLPFFREGDLSGRPAPLFSGPRDYPGFDLFDLSRSFYVVQSNPLPCTVQQITMDTETLFPGRE